MYAVVTISDESVLGSSFFDYMVCTDDDKTMPNPFKIETYGKVRFLFVYFLCDSPRAFACCVWNSRGTAT